VSNAHIIDIESAYPQIPTQFDADTGSAIPVGNILEILGVTVANATYSGPLHTTGSGNTLTANIQVGTERTGAPTDKNDAGIVSFDDTVFAVDAHGYVTLKSGPGTVIDSIIVDNNTAPGTNPVGPDISGQVTILGAAVANHSIPIETHSRAVNTLNVEVQVAKSTVTSPGNKNDAGICSFDSDHFSVDSDGFVQLSGGGTAVDEFTTDVAGPVSPDVNGNVNFTGGQVFSDGSVANTVGLSVEATQYTFLYGEGNNTAMTELGPLTDGQLIIGDTGNAPVAGSLASADGSITITTGAGTIDLSVAAADDAILTITGDAGGALSPTAGNINILGGSQAFTSGAGSTLTVEVDATLNTFLVGAGAGSTVTELGPLTDGQLIIGATGGAPAAGSLASADGSVTITAGTNSVDISVNGNIKTNLTNGIGCHNLGLFYSSPTATIKGADNNNLSATNPAYITTKSNVTPGKLITTAITSNVTFADAGGASVFAGSLFGFLTGDDSSTVTTETTVLTGISFFIYAMLDSNDANPVFSISPVPTIKIPKDGSAILANAASGSADNPYDSMTLTSVTTANYESSNVTLVGTFQANINGSDDWTITSVSPTSFFGFGQFSMEGFGIPFGCSSAASGSLFIDNGGTAPTINAALSTAKYNLSALSSQIEIVYDITLTGSPSGAVDARLVGPIPRSAGLSFLGFGYIKKTGTGVLLPVTIQRGEGNNAYYFDLLKNDGTTAKYQYDELDSGDTLFLQTTYRI